MQTAADIADRRAAANARRSAIPDELTDARRERAEAAADEDPGRLARARERVRALESEDEELADLVAELDRRHAEAMAAETRPRLDALVEENRGQQAAMARALADLWAAIEAAEGSQNRMERIREESSRHVGEARRLARKTGLPIPDGIGHVRPSSGPELRERIERLRRFQMIGSSTEDPSIGTLPPSQAPIVLIGPEDD